MSHKTEWRLSSMVLVATKRVIIVVSVFSLLLLECNIVRAIIYILRVARRGSDASAVAFTVDTSNQSL